MGNYGHLDDDFLNLPEAETWYIKAGLRKRFNHLGATIFYGEYLNGDDGGVAVCNQCTSSELEVWGLGVVQEIDAAAMSVWIKYRHLSYSDNGFAGGYDGNGDYVSYNFASDYEDADYIGVGGLINF